jgi:hypothetical protein
MAEEDFPGKKVSDETLETLRQEERTAALSAFLLEHFQQTAEIKAQQRHLAGIAERQWELTGVHQAEVQELERYRQKNGFLRAVLAEIMTAIGLEKPLTVKIVEDGIHRADTGECTDKGWLVFPPPPLPEPELPGNPDRGMRAEIFLFQIAEYLKKGGVLTEAQLAWGHAEVSNRRGKDPKYPFLVPHRVAAKWFNGTLTPEERRAIRKRKKK